MNLRDLLDEIQNLLGEPLGTFYNLGDRRRRLNIAQRRMVRETQALSGSDLATLVPDVRAYDLPEDFLSFSQATPKHVSLADDYTDIQIVDMADIEVDNPLWRTADSGVPRMAWVENGQILVHPVPKYSAQLLLPYIKAPTDMEDEEDLPFNGQPNLLDFAEGLAFAVANHLSLASNPQLAMVYHQAYLESLRGMRAALQRNPQKQIFIRPEGYR